MKRSTSVAPYAPVPTSWPTMYIQKAADIGDIAVFYYAGAYGLTMSNIEFLSHPRPPEIVLN